MTPRSIATASHGDVAQAAASVFPNGNAVDAVVAGVFAAAAVFPSTLMGPVQILVGGAGAGLRAVDGRNRQPGLGIPRPRGFKEGDVIPPAARAAVPCLPGALAALLATAGSMTLSRVMGPALDLAGAVPERKKFLKRLSQQGPSLLADDAIAGELTHGAGRMGGGLLTQEDLEGALPAIVSCIPTKRFGLPVVTAPWATSVLSDGPQAREGELDTSAVHAVVAADTFGVVAVACFEARSGGVHFAEFGIEAPPFAEPVLRGERRTPPGDTRPAGCPIALVATTEAGVDVALAMTHAGLGESHLSQLLHRMGKAPSVEAAIRAPRAAHEGDGDEASPFASNVGHALGVHRSRTFTRILSDPRR